MIVSPSPFTPSPLSDTNAVLVTSTDGFSIVPPMIVRVGSFVVLPSESSPSSEMSLTIVPVGLVAVAVAVLDTPPAVTA